MYWLDIEVTFSDIIRQQRIIPRRNMAHLMPSDLEYSVLTGLGTVANALSVGDSGTSFDRFEVEVAAFVRTDEYFEPYELHRSAKMIWNDIDVQFPRLEIHVQPKMLRHLVELYLTKRIDTVTMSMKIAVTRQPIADRSSGFELLPLLDHSGRLYFRGTQSELLSVRASLAHERVSSQS
jgi:hypothetical protein